MEHKKSSLLVHFFSVTPDKKTYFIEDFIYKNIIIKKANLVMEHVYKPCIKLSCNINEKIVSDNNDFFRNNFKHSYIAFFMKDLLMSKIAKNKKGPKKIRKFYT